MRGNGVADKKAFLKNGIKTAEEFDRDGDGVFEERVQLDRFEREVRR